MSHYHAEILLPPTVTDTQNAIAEIMQPFDEDVEERGGDEFWDFWVIGGRFSGEKNLAKYDQAALKAFYDVLTERKVTVSSVRGGKQELKPADQIPMVDELWSRHFPEYIGKSCPLFKHSNDQYDSESLLDGDIMDFADVPPTLEMSRVIIGGLSHDKTRFEAKQMLISEFWNGCSHQKAEWDGKFGSAMSILAKDREIYGEEFRDAITPVKGWKVVTVDYHS